jgi:ribonuclease P/MRP protein subunit RPP1
MPSPLPFPTPPRLRILRRCNIFLTDPTTNLLIPQLQQHYDIISARPTNERSLQQACSNLDVDIISLDMTLKPEKPFKFSMIGAAIARGIKIEICYSQGLTADNQNAKRMLISNAVQLIRVTRGRGIIFSSEAKNVLGLRAPSDIINLASIWGLGHERGKDGLSREARSVVEFARLKRTSYRGVIDVVYGGEKPVGLDIADQNKQNPKGQKKQNKRKADSLESPLAPLSQKEVSKALSNKQQKRNKKAEAGK